MNATRRRQGRPVRQQAGCCQNCNSEPRCPTCGGWVSPYCELCAGDPDPDYPLEIWARDCAAVDRAARRGRGVRDAR